MADEIPASVKQARKNHGLSVAGIVGSQLVAIMGMLTLMSYFEGTPYKGPAALAGVALMVLAVAGTVFLVRNRLRESQEVIKAWDHLRSQARAAELESEMTAPLALHPLVEQVRARQASLGDEATALGQKLLQLEREASSITETVDALPDGQAKDELAAALEVVLREKGQTLEALARLYATAQRGETIDPSLQGLLSEVRLPTEPHAEGSAQRGAAQRIPERK